MKKNQGMTIVEILVSVCIIALVLALLFTLLIQVREEENNNSIQSNFLMNQATYIMQIEEDIINYGVKAVGPCELGVTGDINTAELGSDNFKCVQIYFAADYIEDNIGFIQIYNYYQKYERKTDAAGNDVIGAMDGTNAWSIRYQRGSYRKCDGTASQRNPVFSSWQFGGGRIMKDMPSEIDLSDTPYILYTAATDSTNAASLVIPISNLEGEHYDINLSFTFDLKSTEPNSNFICSELENRLECKCKGDENLCNKTIIRVGDASTAAMKNIEKLNSYVCP